MHLSLFYRVASIVVWLVCSGIVMYVISGAVQDTPPDKRGQLKWRWVRIVLVIGGPLTAIGEGIYFGLKSLTEGICISDIIPDTYHAVTQVFANVFQKD